MTDGREHDVIALLVMTDGRLDCLTQTLRSAAENLMHDGMVDNVFIHDDSNDPDYRAMLVDWSIESTGWYVFGPKPGSGKSGFGGAIRAAWEVLRTQPHDFVFHLEDDFTFNRPVDLRAMAGVLLTNPEIVQIALRRQPWNDLERAAGGVVEMHPEAYTDRHVWDNTSRMADGREDPRLHPILEHTQFWTTNPSLYRRSLLDIHHWPDGEHSEGVWSQHLRTTHPDWRFAYWGQRDDGPWVHHIGTERVGTGY